MSSGADFWKKMESEEDLTKAVEASFEKKSVIFKHSTRCHISKMVLQNFEKEVAENSKDVNYYFLDILANRSLSTKIAEEFGVTHKSPQIIVLENGNAVKDASHQSISVRII